MSRVRGIYQQMQGITMEKIIPLFATSSLDHYHYPGVKIRYLVGEPTLVKFSLLDLIGMISIKETRQQALGLTIVTPPATENRVSNTQTKPPPTGRPQPCPSQPPMPASSIDYPPPRGVPWKCITAMMRDEKSCPGCHFNKMDDSPRLKFHQEVRWPSLAKHGYMLRKYVTASATVVDQFNKNYQGRHINLALTGLKKDEHQKIRNQKSSQINRYTPRP